jgi:GNAT superfamily N-acetyltransferase
VIRPAEITDAAAMADVLSGWIDATPWMPRIHTLEQDFGFCQNLITKTDVWVADPVEGFGFLARQNDSIDALYLGSDLRRRGWGSALLKLAQHGRDRLSLWTFQANKDAVRFYEANNFHISDLTSGEGNDEKLPDYYMTWTRGT